MSHTLENGNGVACFLIECEPLLPRGRVLDIAMGNGRNSVFLAENGFDVEGVDVDSKRISKALELAETKGVELRGRVADLETPGYSITRETYDVIICFYYLQRSLTGRIIDGLKPGGMLVYETFIIDQAEFGRPKNRDHLLAHNELLGMFSSLRCLRYREGLFGRRRAIASILAQKTAAA